MTEAKSDKDALEALRRRIDAVDDRLHDLLIERASLVDSVAAVKRADGVPPFRPGRQAQIVRRVLSRHRGRFPRAALVRIWNEILGGGVAMQAELTVALAPGCGELARDQFGVLAPALEFPSAVEVLLAVREGSAAVGVLPLAEDRHPWWLDLAAWPEGVRPRVIARLPFGACGSGTPVADALVIARMEPEASGEDCTLFAVAAPEKPAAARITDAFWSLGLDSTPAAEAPHAFLIAVSAWLATDDRRAERVLKPLAPGLRATWLGAYPRPLPDQLLD